MTIIAQNCGNSIGIRIPKKIAEKLEIKNDTELEVIEDGKSIILKPVSTDPALEELMAGITKENQHEEIDWGHSRKG
ncbi:AbrB/MazE/SpoVT family DNA-binding domain-containing protein [Salinicoccus albus]|uniref:AbrB/MazE/SpoVT family DNA-binding domain-containing protein n=1 Tax=Salinicoccus albus TaxID=418756 RepID=UPI000373B677|nr:AbrB/MazE/SpoVT family DNA-binding domain-containing protein [Salinicoccus albus]